MKIRTAIRGPRLPELASSFFVLSAFMAGGASAQTGGPSSAPAAQSGGLEEIVVTAQRRSESLQKAAVAISVVGGEDVQRMGISEPENLNKAVPGLAIGTGGPSSQIYLRGVGSYGTNGFADPAVQFNVDGIALGRVTGLGGNFFDLERVEVLKGPQGTLYGRNATGGAVNVVSAKPKREGSASVGIDLGNYSLRKFNGHVNVPINDAWAFRIAGQIMQRDGYQTDGTNDEDTRSVRAHVLFSPSDNFSLLASASKVAIKGEGFAQIPYRAAGYFSSSNPWVGTAIASPALLVAQATANRQPPTLFTNGVSYDGGYQNIDVSSYGLQLDAGVGAAGTLTVIANQIKTTNDSKSYGPGFKFQPKDNAKQTTLEARIAGGAGALQWVGGVFAYKEKQDFKFWVDQGFLFNQTGADIQKLDDDTKAVFGELTYSLTDAVRIVGGVRYTDENKQVAGRIWNRQGAPCAAIRWTPATIANIAAAIPWAATNDSGVAYPFPFCTDTVTGDRDWTNVSWKGGIEYDVAPDSLLYAHVSRGFKAGGFFASGDNSTVGNSYRPETLTAFTVGSKNRLADGRVRLNAEAFWWDYKNHQEGYLAPTNPPVPGFGFVTINVPKAKIYGLDAELEWAPTEADRLGVRMQYLHAEYTDFTFNTARPGEFATNAPGSQPPVTVCPSTFVSIGLYRVNCTGQEMPRSPKLSLQADYSHTFTLPGGATLTPGIAAQHSSAYWTAVDYNPLQRQQSFTMYDADITFQPASKKWSAALWGRNLGNEDVWQNSFVHPSGVAFNALRPPRTYGLRINANF